MMPIVAALALLALAVCLLDLVFTLGVIRRLRHHTELISTLSGAMPSGMLAEGETAGPFEAVATTGEPVSRGRLSGRTLVGVFTPRCPACEEKLPAFVESAATFPGGRDQVIAVVVGESEDDTAPYRERLEPVARVVTEPPMTGEISSALEVNGFPSFGVLDQSGTVVGTGLEPARPAATAGV
ncbi:TlpA family protein disulfide reductase [Actinomadura livida]|uniref:Thiol-disulfide isomerase/thioredoxin n=1 Tax=Actinomadura livida TaxID=79909 RepID=A0A7W7IHN6_9ACTN|nr:MULTISPECIES: TlpA disulfide reductase family protein [Actinomadura]MBB4777195.1 thiol-disulfide isomerase/thioredoxin [Actinomadura catellatispora]GGU20968.1 hypothetical protein GCM10010208_52510 [Actinomadura livida]